MELSTSIAAAKTQDQRAQRQSIADLAFAGLVDHSDFASHIHVGADPGIRDTTAIGCLAKGDGASLVGYIGGGTDREWSYTHYDGTRYLCYDPSLESSYGAWVKRVAEWAERNRTVTFKTELSSVSGDFTINSAPVSAEERAARKSPKVTLTIRGLDKPTPEAQLKAICTDMVWSQISAVIDLRRQRGQSGTRAMVDLPTMEEAVALGWIEAEEPKKSAAAAAYTARSNYGDLVGHVRASDEPSIAAMAAKNVQPTPEPVVRVAGIESTAGEIAQALALLRGQNAPAVKETPRGLLCVREGFDHRLGAWNEA